MSQISKPDELIRLHHGDRDKQVLVTTKDGDRFLIPVGMAARACKSFESVEAYLDQLGKTLGKLRHWIRSHGEDVEIAYVTLRDAGLLFLVVRKSKRYNETLESALTELDLEIAQEHDLNMIRLSVLSLPQVSDDGLRSFLDPSNSLELTSSNG